ncbi:protein FAR1-RELATED SEQUENCE 5-like [Coffea arabica]|uniref:Protein FAR1-RELATED SEQUENCE 5-like n=1 Tax=Coffea arabica TaxID=13443 RepID=A0ABM4U669_COFAR
MGFSVRKGYKFIDDNGRVHYRQWVCSREGRRDLKHVNREDRRKEPRPDTRVDYQATLKIRYAFEEDKYVVSEFVRLHTHKLACPSTTKFLKCHRKVSDANYAQAHTLCRVGMKTSQIMKLCGGYQYVLFTMKDLYNRMNGGRMEEIADGDAKGVVAYLFTKKDADSEVYFNFTVTYNGRLGRLFWLDSRSKEDYKYYGDIVVFNSIYNTNRYPYPLVVIYGINNHFCMFIFACVTVPDEEVKTYEWILNNFLEVIDGKQPLSIVTNEAPQMRKAIKMCFLNAKHRFCSWHIQQNLISNIANEEFREWFKNCMYRNCSIDQFETKWANLITSCNLQNND